MLPRLSGNCFPLSFFPAISNGVRNLLAQVDAFRCFTPFSMTVG